MMSDLETLRRKRIKEFKQYLRNRQHSWAVKVESAADNLYRRFCKKDVQAALVVIGEYYYSRDRCTALNKQPSLVQRLVNAEAALEEVKRLLNLGLTESYRGL